MTKALKFDRERAISKMEIFVKNAFNRINKLDIDIEDKFITFRPYLDGLHEGYAIGINSTGLILGPDTDIPFVLDMMNVYNRYEDKEISMEDAWVYMSRLTKGINK
jgi:hypothetical protein